MAYFLDLFLPDTYVGDARMFEESPHPIGTTLQRAEMLGGG